MMFDNLGVSLPLVNAGKLKLLAVASAQDGLRKLSAGIFGGSAEKAPRYMHDEIDRWGKVIKAADIKLQ